MGSPINGVVVCGIVPLAAIVPVLLFGDAYRPSRGTTVLYRVHKGVLSFRRIVKKRNAQSTHGCKCFASLLVFDVQKKRQGAASRLHTHVSKYSVRL